MGNFVFSVRPDMLAPDIDLAKCKEGQWCVLTNGAIAKFNHGDYDGPFSFEIGNETYNQKGSSGISYMPDVAAVMPVGWEPEWLRNSR